MKFIGPFRIEICKLINARARYITEGNAILTKLKIDLTIEGSKFINCGNGQDQRIIFHEDRRSSIIFTNSIFKFDDISNPCLTIDMFSPKVNLEGCNFTNFIPNVISIKSQSQTDFFIFKNSKIENIKVPMINAANMTISPTISGNTFGKCTLQNLLIQYEYDVDEIFLIDNTFSEIEIQGNLKGGPANLQLNRKNNQRCSLNFDGFEFIKNTNRATNGNGRAFQYGGDQSSSSFSISMTNCVFNNNKAPNGHGSALAFSIRYNIEISKCNSIYIQTTSVETIVFEGWILKDN